MAALVLLAAVASLAAQPPNRYVGSKACAGCHTAIYDSFRKTDMGRSVTFASAWTPDSLPAEATVAQPTSGHTFRVYHDNTGWHQSESNAGESDIDHALDYAVGSGANGITFLLKRGNYLFQAPLSYYSKTHAWALSPGYEGVDLGFSRAVPEECISCHAGRPAPAANRPGAFEDPPLEELAIGCENCHGPGQNHVSSAGKQRSSIVNLAKLPPRLAENVCLNCHQTADTRILQPGKAFGDFRPGQWLFDTVAIVKIPSAGNPKDSDLLQHFAAMQSSRCYRASGGKLSCLTCHNPHIQPAPTEAVGYYRAKCLTCHTDASCTVPVKTRAAQTPPDNCSGCHMAKRSVPQVEHSALTNHRILAHPDEPVPPMPQVETDGLVVVDPPGNTAAPRLPKLTLLKAYGQLSANHPEYRDRYSALLTALSQDQPADPTVAEALGHQSFLNGQFEAAVAQLKAALPLHEPGTCLEIAQALIKLGRNEEAIQYLKTGVEQAPYDPLMRKTLILEYINSRSYADARQQLEQYVSTFPEDTFMRQMLQKVSR